MDHTKLFFAAFADELFKGAQSPAISKGTMRDLGIFGAGAATTIGGGIILNKAHKDWKRGREARLRETAMRKAQSYGGGY